MKSSGKKIELQARGKVKAVEGRKLYVSTWLLNHRNERCVEGEVTFLMAKKNSVKKIFREWADSFLQYVDDAPSPPLTPTTTATTTHNTPHQSPPVERIKSAL